MALTAQDRIEAQRLKDAASYRREQLESALSGLAKVTAVRADLQESQAKVIADYQKNAMGAIARVESAIMSGAKAAQIRGMVDLHELVNKAPVDFAKAAYMPDKALLDKVAMAVPVGQAESRTGENAKTAWQTFYKFAQPNSGNILGSYDEMVDRYGPDDGHVSPGDPDLWNNRQRVQTKLSTEREAAENQRRVYASLLERPQVYAEWAKEQGLDPNLDETKDKFAYDLGLDKLLPSVAASPFIAEMKKTIIQPAQVLAQVAAAGPIGTAIDQATEEVEFWRKMIPTGSEDSTELETEDTFRDKLAAWIGRKETRQWAESQGLKIGQTVPLTDDIKKAIAAGQYPGSVFTKYGVYLPAPDDMVAFRQAYRQLNIRPERQVFRAAGLTRGGHSVVEVVVKPPPKERAEALRGPKLVEATKDPAAAKDGSGLWVGKLEDGTYVSTKDGEKWEPMDSAAAQAILASSKLEMEPQPDEVYPLAKPAGEPKTYTGAFREQVYGDAPGSVRFVNPETGREEYIAPEDIVQQRFVNHEPGTHRVRPLDAVRKVASKALTKSAGVEQEPTPAKGPTPTSVTGPLRQPVKQAEPQALPDVEQMEQAQREKNRAVIPQVMKNADEALAMSRVRTPMSNPPPETTTPTTTTPTASVGPAPQDALRRKFKQARVSPAGTSYAAPPE